MALVCVFSVNVDMLQFDVPYIQISEDIFGCILCLHITSLAAACSSV